MIQVTSGHCLVFLKTMIKIFNWCIIILYNRKLQRITTTTTTTKTIQQQLPKTLSICSILDQCWVKIQIKIKVGRRTRGNHLAIQLIKLLNQNNKNY